MLKAVKGTLHGDRIVLDGNTGLRTGDKVVVIEPTSDLVLSSRTGRILGRDEKVLGRGQVIKHGDTICVMMQKMTESLEGVNIRKHFSRKATSLKKEKTVIVKLINGKIR